MTIVTLPWKCKGIFLTVQLRVRHLKVIVPINEMY